MSTMAPAMSTTHKQTKARNPYGSNYILTMETIHKKGTLATSIGAKPMNRFLETHVYDLYNSEYKHLLNRNTDRAEAVILVQTKFWAEWKKSGRDIGAARDGYGLRDGQIAKLFVHTGRGQGAGVKPDLAKLEREIGNPQKKRKRTKKVVEDERELKRQRMATAEALGSKHHAPIGSEKDGMETGKLSASPYFRSTATPTHRVPTPPIYAPHAPQTQVSIPFAPIQAHTKNRPVFINRDRKCIADARRYLEVLVRNSRADHFPSNCEEIDGYLSSDTDTETYNAEDSALLLGLRFHPLNTSDAKEIVDGVARNEAILKAGYCGKDLRTVAQEYETGRKELTEVLVEVVPWDLGMRVRDESKRLVNEVLKY
jgi:hypothetical protein